MLRGILFRVGALLVGVVVGLVALEVGLRAARDPERYLPYHRNAVRVFYPSDRVTPGVSGLSYFTTNSLGLRGPEPGDERFRLLTIGGSTTACTVLDDSETWPRLLMERVNSGRAPAERLWVGNSGIDGLNSRHHLIHARLLLAKLPPLDIVLVYAGLNDVGLWLYREEFEEDFTSDPALYEATIAASFRVSNYTAPDEPAYKRLELWKRASVLKAWVLSHQIASQRDRGAIVQDAELEWIERERARRGRAEKEFVHRAKLETLPVALDSYGDNLRRIALEVRARNAQPVFVAQAIQHQFLTPEERERLWMGAMDGGRTYVKEEQMLALLGRFNERMAEVAAETGAVFVDLPALLEGERDLFYDGVHFNEKGARVTAEVLARVVEPLLDARSTQSP